ncbi:DsrE/DsrF/DrsH-like family protein [Halothiobacillus sp. DCM-1]|uniref:DsrE/DsrF/DrsH-like family protein n=1 Tax=Halothiobacillus sp. DCM-1 TaxID=3112558 RepID=UPI003253ABEC
MSYRPRAGHALMGGGLALVVAHGDPATLRVALSLALAAASVGDEALVFANQSGLALLTHELPSPDLLELRTLATEAGVRWVACADSLAAMGLSRDALIRDVELAGAVRFYLAARAAKVSLYL